MNSTLVCLLGSLRGGERTWTSLRENLLDLNGADLALMIGKTTQRTLLHKWARYVWTIPERSDAEWGVALDHIAAQLKLPNPMAWRGDLGFFKVTKRIAPRVHANISWMSPAFLGPSQWSATINLVMRWELKHRLIKHGLHRKYKRFVVTRSDQFYSCPLDLQTLDPKYVWVPVRADPATHAAPPRPFAHATTLPRERTHGAHGDALAMSVAFGSAGGTGLWRAVRPLDRLLAPRCAFLPLNC
jgi:hypothetical protein